MESRELRNIVEEILAEEDTLFLVDVIIKGHVGSQKVLVLIDGDEGISIDKCAWVSRKLGGILEEEELFTTKYLLEVSSPGLDHPLSLHRQYVKNKGRNLSVELLDGSKTEGKLIEVDLDKILLEDKKEARAINFEDIRKSKVVVAFK